ncbi:hypothetical protein FRC01_013060, partial [Tulasnella sp. 417]
RKVFQSLTNSRVEATRIERFDNAVCKHGGQADVELAALRLPSPSQPNENELVAVRKMRFSDDKDDERVLAAFAHQLSLINELDHENIVKLRGFVEDLENGIAWMIFVWEANGNVLEFVQSEDWEIPERMSLIRDVMAGVGYLHNRDPPICHGDLKSLNILVNSEYRAVVSDFGSARIVSHEEGKQNRQKEHQAPLQADTTGGSPAVTSISVCPSGSRITLSGPVLTLRWAAPELLAGETSTLASDIWALGLICLEGWVIPSAIKLNGTMQSSSSLLWIQFGRESMRKGELKEATEYFQRALSAARSTGNEDATATALLHLGDIYQMQGYSEKAKVCYSEAHKNYIRLGFRDKAADAMCGLGNACNRQHYCSTAEEWFTKAKSRYKESNNVLGVANALAGLGDVRYQQGKYKQAEALYTEAMDTYETTLRKALAADMYYKLGRIHQMQGNDITAEKLYAGAKETYRQFDIRLCVAKVDLGLADLYSIRGDYTRAMASCMKAKETYTHSEDLLGLANATKALAALYCKLEDYPSAQSLYEQARDVYVNIENIYGELACTRGLKEVCNLRGRPSNVEGSTAFVEGSSAFVEVGNTILDPLALAYPALATNPKTHTIIISIAKADPADPSLAGVQGDFPLILDELNARTTGTLQVITNLSVPRLSPQAQMLFPNSQNIRGAILNAGQVMKAGSICYIYISGGTEQDSIETSSEVANPILKVMPLPSGGRLDGKEIVSWLKTAARNGGTFIVIADVCFAASFIRLPVIYDVYGGSLSWSKISEELKWSSPERYTISKDQAQLNGGQVIALLSTDYSQLAVTIDSGAKEPYPGYHNLFTFALFSYLRKQPLDVDAANLLIHLRKHSAWHPSKPRPQICATTEGLRQLPLGRPSA